MALGTTAFGICADAQTRFTSRSWEAIAPL